MFTPAVNYFMMLRLEHQKVVPEFLGLPFLTAVELQYPSSDNEQLISNACSEVLAFINKIDGITTVRYPNSIHFTCDENAVEMDPTIVERHDVVYDEKNIGVVVICAEGSVFQTFSTLQ